MGASTPSPPRAAARLAASVASVSVPHTAPAGVNARPPIAWRRAGKPRLLPLAASSCLCPPLPRRTIFHRRRTRTRRRPSQWRAALVTAPRGGRPQDKLVRDDGRVEWGGRAAAGREGDGGFRPLCAHSSPGRRERIGGPTWPVPRDAQHAAAGTTQWRFVIAGHLPLPRPLGLVPPHRCCLPSVAVGSHDVLYMKVRTGEGEKDAVPAWRGAADERREELAQE